MNTQEASALLEGELARWRVASYDQLVSRIPAGSVNYERVAPGGAKYQLEIQVFWDDRPGGNIRVIGAVDDGGWRAFVPVSRAFIKAPDGSFVGE